MKRLTFFGPGYSAPELCCGHKGLSTMGFVVQWFGCTHLVVIREPLSCGLIRSYKCSVVWVLGVVLRAQGCGFNLDVGFRIFGFRVQVVRSVVLI